MPRKERRAKEKKRAYEKDGDYGPIDTGYVFGNPGFLAMPPIYQLAEILAWLACFKERDDVLKPEWQTYIRRKVGVDHTERWRKIVGRLTERKCWEILPDGSLKVLKIKEKRPHFPWKGKGHNGHPEGTKTGNIESITLSNETGHAEGAPVPLGKRWTDEARERMKAAKTNA